MIGQLRNNLRRGVSVAAMSITLFAAPAFAETISGQLIYTDWYVLIKDESGVQTVMARGNLERSGPRPTSVQFNINEKASGKNYLYIIAGSHPKDGLDPFLAATLRGTKTLNTGDKAIEVFQSDYTDINAPTNTVMIREIIEGGMGGGTFGPSFPAIYGNSQKLIGKFSGQGIWAKGQIDNGHAVVFRIPYSALLNSPSEPKALTPSISGITQGVTVDIDVREILGSVFAKKGKKKDIPKDENKTPTDNFTPIIIEENPVTFVTSQLPAETEAVVKNDPVIITRPPEIITRYVQDPNLLRDRNRLRDEHKNMVEHIGGLTEVIKRQESTIREINNNLNKKENAANSTLALLKERDKTIKSLQIKLNTKVPPIGERETSLPLIPLAAGGLGLLSFGGLLGLILGRKKRPLNNKNKALKNIQTPEIKADHKSSKTLEQSSETRRQTDSSHQMISRQNMPITPRNGQIDYLQKPGFDFHVVSLAEKNEDGISLIKKKFPQDRPNFNQPYVVINKWHGMAIPGSVMIAGQGQLPKPIAHLQTAYDSVGRVGYAQTDKALGTDENFGTGILIAEQFIITNCHVWEENIDEFTGEKNLGIEFHGEKGSDASDFYEFEKDADPIFFPETDAVILKLKKKVPGTKRKPLQFSTKTPKDMEKANIVVVGYPAEPSSLFEEEIEAMANDLVFNVKRYSEGKIMPHITDHDSDMMIETRTSGHYSTPPSETISAICHTASTLEGSSGSAVICKKTGELLALHFGYDLFFDLDAPTNLAIPGILLSDIVTSITSQLEKAD